VLEAIDHLESPSGEIRRIATEIVEKRDKQEPTLRATAPIDWFFLLVVVAGCATLASWLYILIGHDHMQLAARGVAVMLTDTLTTCAVVIGGLYILNRANTRRHCAQARRHDALAKESTRRYDELAIATRDLAAEMEQMNALLSRVLTGGTRPIPTQLQREQVEEMLERVQRRAPQTRKLTRSEYYEVYTDVLMDLSGIAPGDGAESQAPEAQ